MKTILNKMDYIRALVVSIFTGVTAFLHPIAGDVYSLVIIFVLNFFFGLINGILVKGENFDFKKAFRCVCEATIFFVLVAAIFTIGKLKDNETGAIQCVSFVVYSVIYFYSVNILKNLKELLREGSVAHAVVSWLYWVVSAEFVKSIPYLAGYLKEKERKDGEAERNNNPRQRTRY